MRSQSSKLPLALLALTLAVPALAHDTWLLPRRTANLRRSAKPEADWESDFTTMTFEVR